MRDPESLLTRRGLLRGGLALGAAALFAPGVFAEHLMRSPAMTEGPFYPDHLPLDQDNDLLIVGDSLTPAVGQVTHLSGRILDTNGTPLRNAEIEIWQCDANQVYLTSHDSVPKAAQRDKNFQGFGRFTTGSTGEYRFRTIKPVAYPGRPAPHIHYKIKVGGREVLTSQIFIAGFAGNARDGVFRSVQDPIERELIQTEFTPIKESKVGELAARFDIVLGRTPADADDHQH